MTPLLEVERPTERGPDPGNGPPLMAAIPCHNEAPYLADVVTGVLALGIPVLVVDDGSTDQTADIALAAGAAVLRHGRQRGYGEALKSCFRAAIARRARVLVTLDGDLQHNPAELLKVATPVQEGQLDLCVGSRFLGTALEVPAYRQFGIGVITALFNFGAGRPLTDAQSGYRAYRGSRLSDLSLTDSGMGASVESLILARKNGWRLGEVPITCRYHEGGSSLHPVVHGVGVAWKVCVHRLRVWT